MGGPKAHVRLLARYGCDAELLHPAASNKVRVASAQRWASEKMLAGALLPTCGLGSGIHSQPVGNLTHTMQPQEAT